MPPSSTSSSRSKLGPPWGVAYAAGLLLLVELGLRTLNPTGRIPSDGADRELAYREVPFELAVGAPDVIVVGSSRARLGVLPPVLRAAIEARGLGKTVKNFSLGGAEAEEVALVMKRIADAAQRPKLIVWALSAREFQERDLPAPNARFLWRPSDWRTARRDLGAAADQYLPDALKNEAARWSYVARYRFPVRDLLTEPKRWPAFKRVIAPGPRRPTPLQGGMPAIMRGAGRNFSAKLSMKRVRKYVGSAYQTPNWPQGYQAKRFEVALRAAARIGVPLLLIELPSHDLLERAMPRGTSNKFRRHVAAVAGQHGVRFVQLADLGVKFGRRDFREQSHLNYRGALKYSEAIAPTVVKALKKAKRRAR